MIAHITMPQKSFVLSLSYVSANDVKAAVKLATFSSRRCLILACSFNGFIAWFILLLDFHLFDVIDTDFLLIITSTADELSSGTNIDDLERLWTPKILVLVNFSRFYAVAHI